VDLEITRNDDESFEFTILDPTRVTPEYPQGVPVNLSGAAIRFTAKRSILDDDASAVIRLDNGSLHGVTITDALNGVCVVDIPASATAGITPPAGLSPESLRNWRAQLVWDLQVRTSGGKTFTPLSGLLLVVPDVSISSP
jgi:hypothetical protein